MNQPISTHTEDPEYYAELLKTPRLAHQPGRLLSDKRFYPDTPSVRDVDSLFAWRLQTLLDVVADTSLCQRGNVSATMARLANHRSILETKLYIVFDHENDGAARSCPQHLQSIFEMLRKVPYNPSAMDGSPKDITEELKGNLIELCRVIHDYSFDIFAYRVNKRKGKLSDIRRYIEQDETYFTAQQRGTLLKFLLHVDVITAAVASAQGTKHLSTTSIRMLIYAYSYWTKHNLLLEDAVTDNKITLLDNADTWLTEKHGLDFQLRRWALKIMSFVISANRLFVLSRSRRLRRLLEGTFSVQVLTSQMTTPYRCDLSTETIQVALDAALAGTVYLSADWDKERKTFVEELRNRLEASEVVHRKPTVHAELAMIMAMVKGEIKHVEPYIGVSKLSCIMCSHYIHAFNEVTKQTIATQGSHGKAYPGWFWPSLPSCDGELRPVFLGRIKQQLLSDFEEYTRARRLSDSSVGSGSPKLNVDPTDDEMEEMADEILAALWQ